MFRFLLINIQNLSLITQLLVYKFFSINNLKQAKFFSVNNCVLLQPFLNVRGIPTFNKKEIPMKLFSFFVCSNKSCMFASSDEPVLIWTAHIYDQYTVQVCKLSEKKDRFKNTIFCYFSVAWISLRYMKLKSKFLWPMTFTPNNAE